jgi:hypothetical protein
MSSPAFGRLDAAVKQVRVRLTVEHPHVVTDSPAVNYAFRPSESGLEAAYRAGRDTRSSRGWAEIHLTVAEAEPEGLTDESGARYSPRGRGQSSRPC